MDKPTNKTDEALRLAEIDAEFEDRVVTCATKIAEAEVAVKAAVVGAGESIKGSHMHAVYNFGRAHWDDKKLVKYALAHPEILLCREQGDPYVTMRWTGK